MKREIHEAEVRKNIIRAARKLFMRQGYENTTVRQIKDVAGVKIGTLYHFYRNKEDIFAVIVSESFFRVLERTRRLTNDNTSLDIAAELAWHVYTMVLHAQSAELYLVSYNSIKISEQLLSDQTARSAELFAQQLPHWTTHEHRCYAMLARGLMQSISLQAVAGTLGEPEPLIRRSIEMLLKILGTPADEITETFEQLNTLNLKERVQTALKKDQEMAGV
ncbi:MAG: TetR/AcrR family transcriptional regulator [Bacteroidota bacterium]